MPANSQAVGRKSQNAEGCSLVPPARILPVHQTIIGDKDGVDQMKGKESEVYIIEEDQAPPSAQVSGITVRLATTADLEDVVQGNIDLAWDLDEKRLDRKTARAGVLATIEHPSLGPYYVATSPTSGRYLGQLRTFLELDL